MFIIEKKEEIKYEIVYSPRFTPSKSPLLSYKNKIYSIFILAFNKFENCMELYPQKVKKNVI